MEQSWILCFFKTLRRSAYVRSKAPNGPDGWSRGLGLVQIGAGPMVHGSRRSGACYFKYRLRLELGETLI